MGLQAIENKALSRGIIRKSACILAEITIRKSQSCRNMSHMFGYRQSNIIHIIVDGPFVAFDVLGRDRD